MSACLVLTAEYTHTYLDASENEYDAETDLFMSLGILYERLGIPLFDFNLWPK